VKTIKVANLTGRQLDYWVAKAERPETNIHFVDESRLDNFYKPSTDWQDGGQIIDREGIDTRQIVPGLWAAGFETEADCDRWGYVTGLTCKHEQNGETALIAAMRTYVASKFGTEVEDTGK
jgi:hypothetical protein